MPLVSLRIILSKTGKVSRWKHGLGCACNMWLPGEQCHCSFSSLLILFSSRMHPCRTWDQRKFCHFWKRKVILSWFCGWARTDPWEPHISFDRPSMARLSPKLNMRGEIKSKGKNKHCQKSSAQSGMCMSGKHLFQVILVAPGQNLYFGSFGNF